MIYWWFSLSNLSTIIGLAKAFVATVIVAFSLWSIWPRIWGNSAVKMSSAAYTSGTFSIAYITTPNEEVSKKLAREIVDRQLAACVNIIPKITSIYKWKGELNEDSEFLMMIKTRTSVIPDLAKFVKENHPYEVAEVISTPIQDGNPPYLAWLDESVPKRPL